MMFKVLSAVNLAITAVLGLSLASTQAGTISYDDGYEDYIVEYSFFDFGYEESYFDDYFIEYDYASDDLYFDLSMDYADGDGIFNFTGFRDWSLSNPKIVGVDKITGELRSFDLEFGAVYSDVRLGDRWVDLDLPFGPVDFFSGTNRVGLKPLGDLLGDPVSGDPRFYTRRPHADYFVDLLRSGLGQDDEEYFRQLDFRNPETVPRSFEELKALDESELGDYLASLGREDFLNEPLEGFLDFFLRFAGDFTEELRTFTPQGISFSLDWELGDVRLPGESFSRSPQDEFSLTWLDAPLRPTRPQAEVVPEPVSLLPWAGVFLIGGMAALRGERRRRRALPELGALERVASR